MGKRVFRGEIYSANIIIDKKIGKEEKLVVIIQNDIGNKYSPTTIVMCLEKEEKKLIFNRNLMFTIKKLI